MPGYQVGKRTLKTFCSPFLHPHGFMARFIILSTPDDSARSAALKGYASQARNQKPVAAPESRVPKGHC